MPTSRPQPRGLHALPALWRVHRVHHADSDFDYSTAFRVHPLEAMTTVVTLMVVVWMLGVPPLAVVIHQTLSTASTILEHANIRLPAAAEAVARTVLVTPDLHRVRHSATPEETDTNFATILSVWDRWLGTYRAQPAAGHEGMEIGWKEFREPKYLTLPWTLALPFLPMARATASEAPARSSWSVLYECHGQTDAPDAKGRLVITPLGPGSSASTSCARRGGGAGMR